MIVIVARIGPPSQVRKAFLVLLGVMTIWSAGTILEMDVRLLTGVSYPTLIDICYIGICFAPIAVLYLGRVIMKPDWRPKPIHSLFLIIPVISVVMVFTNQLHNLFFIEYSLYSSEAVYGAYYYFHSLYSYGCIVAGIVFMLIASSRHSGIFSRQSILVMTGVVITLVLNMLYSFGVGNLPFSISVVAFTLTMICFAVAFLKYQFIAELPITMQQVVDLISDGYLVVDRRLQILSYNQALLRLFPEYVNFTFAPDLRTLVERYMVDASFDRFVEMQARAVEMQETVSVEKRLAGGAHVIVEVTPVIRSNVHVGSIILVKDVTQSKQFIEATEAASRAKSDFLSHMSHEIRTPLNAIIGMINIGMDTEDIKKKDYCFERADSASKHLLGLINDILDMSKIEADKFELSYGVFEFEGMLKSITNVVNVRIDEKRQSFIINIGSEVPLYIGGDELRLSQVITNLLTNAIKFTPENGTITLNIEKIEETDNEVRLRVEVADTGIGISKEQQEKLFMSFNQADANIAKNYGGTGLGLAISKRIIELMDGEIWIESELGEGAKFIFTMKADLPEKEYISKLSAKTRKTDSGDPASHSEPGASKRRYDFSMYTLLAAEDIEINREIMSSILEETGILIDYAENGKAAVSRFRNDPEKYDLILMDVNMPVMGGYEATQAIRALDIEYAKSIPIVAMTASVFKEDIEKCLSSGMNDHTGKPIDADAILGMLNKYLTNPEEKRKLKNVHELEHGIAWDDSLLTGNAMVDMRHQRIFERLSDIVHSCEDGSETAKLDDTLSFLVNHAIRHFTDEEALLLEYGYPDYEAHKQEHNDFKETVGELMQRFEQNGASEELSMDVNKIIVRWLIYHVQHEDKKFSEYIRNTSSIK